MSSMPIETFMTPAPHTIGVDQPLSKAHAFMREHRVRHLPVLEGGRLVGILSDRDLHLIETLRDVDPNDVSVEEAMSSAVYAVPATASLARVANEMAQHKYGSVVIMRDDAVIGIFTAVDACAALAELISQRVE